MTAVMSPGSSVQLSRLKRLSAIAVPAAAVMILLSSAQHPFNPGDDPAGIISAPDDLDDLKVEISFSESVREGAVTGRVYLAVSREEGRSGRGPVWQAGETGVPLFGINVEELHPGEWVTIDGDLFGHPVQSLDKIPPGDYRIQGFVNIYTKFDRTDGHTVWLHMDRWEGQNWRRSPGNLFSTPQQVTIDPDAGGVIRLVCDQVIPPVVMPAETEDVKIIRFESNILSRWWSHPIYIGATVRLPRGYDDHPDVYYPVNYIQGHFSTRPPRSSGSD